ncbi:uncharacterized protein B0I36DRAFT_328384 [Microdochium trichocladiopsis]|uniref:Uncharacterized protein n=1 Tax=Microdochium trichocladiopsis TaxID=1682393 RepID=A0A9P8Y344_9PEZI|nr:uncharacterized protein B0I36DRAFT_328384 [Microdochium trichocladiopsis]KAH7027979.1 hypothetical protein B0I36DRAFT_328384 [Microdochium trichocladiopsis]
MTTTLVYLLTLRYIGQASSVGSPSFMVAGMLRILGKPPEVPFAARSRFRPATIIVLSSGFMDDLEVNMGSALHVFVMPLSRFRKGQ